MRGSGSLKDKAFELLSCSLLITCHPEPCFGEGPPAMCRTTLPSSGFLARESRLLVKKPDSKQLSPKYRGRSFAKTELRMTVLRKFAAVKQSVLYHPHQPALLQEPSQQRTRSIWHRRGPCRVAQCAG